jgi:hypothetical protein
LAYCAQRLKTDEEAKEMTAPDVNIIASEAIPYFRRYDQEGLYAKLEQEWARVEGGDISTRSDLGDYLRGVAKLIAKGIVQNSLGVTVTMGVVATEVIRFAQASGYNLDLYRVPIGILTAIVARALVDQLGIVIRDKS